MKREARALLRKVYRSYHLPPGGFEDWTAIVEDVEVEMHPNGRAILRHPRANVPVEIRFDPAVGVTAVHLAAPFGEPLPPVEIPISAFVAALELARAGMRRKSVVVQPQAIVGTAAVSTAGVEVIERPSPGKRPSLAFYRQLVDEYDALVRAGGPDSKNPVAVIARRRHEQPGTVKSWLARGRRYLKGERS